MSTDDYDLGELRITDDYDLGELRITDDYDLGGPATVEYSPRSSLREIVPKSIGFLITSG